MKTDRLVLVEWDDAWQDQDNFATAHGIAQTHQAMKVVTLGWVIVDNEAGISLANEKSQEEPPGYRGRTFIPRAMVTRVTEVRLVKPSLRVQRKKVEGGVDIESRP